MMIEGSPNQCLGDGLGGVVEWRVAYADTDAGGVLYHARYVELAERSRLEWLTSLGWSVRNLQDHDRVVLMVRQLKANYLLPAYLEDKIKIGSRILSVSPLRLVCESLLFREGFLLARIEVELVCVDLDKSKPRRMPSGLFSSFQRLLGSF
jgi:acyl-CoA thioester hydrolase